MIKHHPDDDLLLAFAAGRSEAGPALLVAVHLESCPDCRARLHALQAVGGALLEAEEPQALEPEALARTLAAIDAPAAPARPPATPAWPAPALPDGAPWPRALRGCAISRWRWMAPGMHFARVRLPYDPDASLYLLQIAPGRSLARHTHTNLELTQVLCGAFDDGRDRFAAGDFDAVEGDVHHEPAVASGGACVCLAYVDGRLRFDGWLARALGSALGM
jgi:putative transcriptional regulator